VSWQDRVIAELENAEPDLADCGFDDADWPTYRKNALRQLTKAFVPTLKLRKTSTFTPRELGGFVGHKLAYVKPFREGFKFPRPVGKNVSQTVGIAMSEMEEGMRAYYPAVRRAVRRCLAIACEAPGEDCAQFFDGFSRALTKGSITARGRLAGATDATEFYILVVYLGPLLKQGLRSMGEFHDFCVALWGPRAGDRKTTEKRCQRIRLSFDSDEPR
jgi:hypothetical protein